MLNGFFSALGAIISKVWLPALIIFVFFCVVSFIVQYRKAKRRAKALESFERENAKDNISGRR